MKKRRYLGPFEIEIERLGRGSVGLGSAPDGAPVQVRGAPPGSRLRVVPMGRQKGVWQARREGMVRPPPRAEQPPCAIFGLCGGCALQELPLDAQRAAKVELALREIGEGVVVEGLLRGVHGVPQPYGYRNRVELSFLTRRYVSEAAHRAGAAVEGRWCGFHAPGRFDRVVDAERCWLAGEATNAVIAAVRAIALDPDAPMPWDNRAHTGFWRHLLVREASTGEVLVGLYAASPSGDAPAWVERVADAVCAVPGVVGFVWATNDGVADVARGEVQRVWGRDWLEERLGTVTYRLSATSFFQTSTAGAQVLYDVIGRMASPDGPGGTLLDLYCGIGAIGLYLANRFERVLGIEESAESVADATRNAAANGVAHARFVAAKVEDALSELSSVREAGGRLAIVVDPPRVGLHPRVAKALAATEADVLVYVACNPASLGRDAVVLEAGGWRLEDLEIVDLFPQTGHVEAVARFVRVR